MSDDGSKVTRAQERIVTLGGKTVETDNNTGGKCNGNLAHDGAAGAPRSRGVPDRSCPVTAAGGVTVSSRIGYRAVYVAVLALAVGIVYVLVEGV